MTIIKKQCRQFVSDFFSGLAWGLLPSLCSRRFTALSRRVRWGALWGLVLSLFSSAGQAHVKWFAPKEEADDLSALDAETLALAGILLVIGVLLAKVVDRVVCQFSLTPQRLFSHSTRPLRLVYYLIAVYFLGAAMSSVFLTPHIQVSEPLLYGGVAAQLLIYTFLLLDRCRVICAALIALLFGVAGVSDPSFVLEYPLLLGLAWIILYAKDKPTVPTLWLLRILLGVSLVTLAFTEKLNNPAMALALLERHDFNFMTSLGFNYSDQWFVYSAGVVELLLGLVLLTGWVTRLAVASLFSFMVATNVYFLAVGEYHMALVEFIGHLPIFACGILLLFYHPTVALGGTRISPRGGRATMSAAPGRLR